MLVTTSARSSPSRRVSSISCSILILILASSLGCPKPPPRPLPVPEPAVCRKWNREQLIGFYALVQLAKAERAKGDAVHVAAAVEATGALLTRCGILVRKQPGPADDPDPISSERRGTPPPMKGSPTDAPDR